MLFNLRLNIIQQVLLHGRSANPIHQAKRPEIAPPLTQQVCVHPARDSAKDEATRQDGISRIRESLFDADERKVEMISEQVEAKEDGW